MTIFYGMAVFTGVAAYALSATLLAVGFFLVGIGLVFLLHEDHTRLPQGWLFLPVAALGLAGMIL
jgi:hypothetical protein